MAAKKVILFIVEGVSDMEALSVILSRLISSKNIQFQIVNGDITSDKDSNSANILSRINSIIKDFLDRTFFTKQNICEIIHLVDTDGAYVDETYIEEDAVEEFIYSPEKIKSKSIASVAERNNRKSAILNKLVPTSSIAKIPYSIYFFSCNIDHVLHNICNLSKDEKIDKAYDFSDMYDNDIPKFIEFFNAPIIKVEGDYFSTWNYLKDKNNSLKRCSNFHIALNRFSK